MIVLVLICSRSAARDVELSADLVVLATHIAVAGFQLIDEVDS